MSGASGQLSRLRQPVALGACALVLGYFVWFFQQGLWQPTVDVAWAVAVLCWVVGFWQSARSASPRFRQPYWFYALYAAALVPFCTNWRWAMTADSVGWALGGMYLAEHGPTKSVLSLLGVGQFGFTQMALHNIFMVLIQPTLFWHRVGQVGVGVLSVVAITTVYGRLVGRSFGMLVAACAMSTSIMIVHTLCSYPLMDAIACGNAVFAAGVWVHREPESRKAWLGLGLLTGVLLFLTPNSWAMGMCVWGWLLLAALWHRWPIRHVLIGGFTVVIFGLPVLIQLARGEGALLFSQVEHPAWTVAKVVHLLREAAYIPFSSPIESAGAFGPQLPPYFRWLFIPGILVTPILARYFPGARLVFSFYAINLVLLAFTQGPYETVSVKRALLLIPMATYFVFLPFHRYLRSVPVVLVIIAVWASFGVYNMLYKIQPGRVGYTFLDGLIEAHQRFSPSPVCIYLSRDYWSEAFNPGGGLERLYRLSPRLRQVNDVKDPACSEYLCYVPAIDTVDLAGLGYSEVTMMNSVELHCGRKGS